MLAFRIAITFGRAEHSRVAKQAIETKRAVMRRVSDHGGTGGGV
jgi:hypothetical protein